MPTNKHAEEKLKDLNEKLHSAKDAVIAADSGAREKADLKLIQQDVTAEKMKARRPEAPKHSPTDVEGKLDKALKESFPGSDPVSFVQAAPINEGDKALSTVDIPAKPEKKKS
jgi:hypothetical protein